MAYAPIMPKLVSIHSPKIMCKPLSMNTLAQILQSKCAERSPPRRIIGRRRTGSSQGTVVLDGAGECQDGASVTSGGSEDVLPEISVRPLITMLEDSGDDVDEKHFLPSKFEGKSEIALMPISRKKKACGHTECESLVCEADFQRLAEAEGEVTPLIAVNINSGEEDAVVRRHCERKECDALSIDHDRCRRAVVVCRRCDQSKVCDICNRTLKTRKAQMNHKNCKRRHEYRHNKVSRAKLMRDRMRDRELQILEATRLNRNDYSDPINGQDRAFENLKNNSELVVIAKAPQQIKQQHPQIRITAVTGAPGTPIYTADNVAGNALTARFPFILPAQNTLLGKRSSTESLETARGQPKNILELSSTGVSRNQFISITPTAAFAQSINLNNYLQQPQQQQQQKRTTSGVAPQGTSYYMPIRVVPIAGLKTQPSLLHQTQGIPKFCLVSQTPDQSATFAPAVSTGQSASSAGPQIAGADPTSLNYAKIFPRILPAQLKTNQIVRIEANVLAEKNSRKIVPELGPKRLKNGSRRARRRKIGPKRGSKSFECTFCYKRFSTDWYFKLHIAKHKGQIKFTCEYCNKPFMHLFNMTKHIMIMHKDVDDDDEGGECSHLGREDSSDDRQYMKCLKCRIDFNTKSDMERHRCPITCLKCHSCVADGDLMLHLSSEHGMSDEKALEELEKQNRRRHYNAMVNRRKRVDEEFVVKTSNGSSKRKNRPSVASNDTRETDEDEDEDANNVETTPGRRASDAKNRDFVQEFEPTFGEQILEDHEFGEQFQTVSAEDILYDDNLVDPFGTILSEHIIDGSYETESHLELVETDPISR